MFENCKMKVLYTLQMYDTLNQTTPFKVITKIIHLTLGNKEIKSKYTSFIHLTNSRLTKAVLVGSSICLPKQFSVRCSVLLPVNMTRMYKYLF